MLLLSQRVSLTLLAQGDRSVGKLAEYTARFITDHIADFILSRGGWVSTNATFINHQQFMFLIIAIKSQLK